VSNVDEMAEKNTIPFPAPKQFYLLKWMSPVISHREVEELFAWMNQHLIDVQANPMSGMAQVGVMPIIENDLEAILIQFKMLLSPAQSDLIREAIWTELFAQITPGPKPFALSLQSEIVSTTRKSIFIFDMDSTVINQEVIDELARTFGIYDKVAAITERAMQGKLDFEASLRERCKLLKGLTTYQAANIIPSLSVSPGGESLFQWLRGQQIKTAIVSGGFEFVLKHFQKQLHVDQVYAHRLVSDDEEVFTGEVEEPIIDGAYKKKIAGQLKTNYGFSAEQTVIIGDGANDVPMMSEAGVSVSFCGKPKLSTVANTLVFDRNLLWLKYLV
jgi:phosphoserine phosphatase SerB